MAKAPDGPRLVLAAADTVSWQDVAAEITTVDQAQVLARIPGILSTLAVREGDLVRKGQVIGRIVDSQLGYQSGAYGAQAAAAQAQAAQATAELDRVRFLHENGVYAKARLEQAQAAASAAQAQVRAAHAQQAAVGAVAGQGGLVAPADGRVLRADVPAGAPVAPGMAVAAGSTWTTAPTTSPATSAATGSSSGASGQCSASGAGACGWNRTGAACWPSAGAETPSMHPVASRAPARAMQSRLWLMVLRRMSGSFRGKARLYSVPEG